MKQTEEKVLPRKTDSDSTCEMGGIVWHLDNLTRRHPNWALLATAVLVLAVTVVLLFVSAPPVVLYKEF